MKQYRSMYDRLNNQNRVSMSIRHDQRMRHTRTFVYRSVFLFEVSFITEVKQYRSKYYEERGVLDNWPEIQDQKRFHTVKTRLKNGSSVTIFRFTFLLNWTISTEWLMLKSRNILRMFVSLTGNNPKMFSSCKNTTILRLLSIVLS